MESGAQRVAATGGACWLCGFPAVCGEKLPGRRHRVRLLCARHDVAVFGGPVAAVPSGTPAAGENDTRVRRPRARYAWCAEDRNADETGWLPARHPVHGELVGGGLVFVDDDRDPGLQAVAGRVVDAWTAQLVLDDPQWAWEENWGRWHVWDLRRCTTSDPFGPVRAPEESGVRPEHFGRYLQTHLVPPDMTVVRSPLQLHHVAHTNAASIVATSASPPTREPLLHL